MDLEPIAEMFQEHLSNAGSAVVDQAQANQGSENKDSKDSEEKSSGSVVDANHALVRNLINLHATYNEVRTERDRDIYE